MYVIPVKKYMHTSLHAGKKTINNLRTYQIFSPQKMYLLSISSSTTTLTH